MVKTLLAAITVTVLLASSAAPSSAQYRYRGGYGYGGWWNGGAGAVLGLGLGLGFLGGALATAPYYTAPYYAAPGYGYALLQPYPPLGTGVIHYSNITHTCQIARLHGGKWCNRPAWKSSRVHGDAPGGD
jgi:hypothetical protein